MSSVKVAVRVRPFNSREIERGSKCIIEMKGNQTIITNPANIKEGQPVDPAHQKTFSYDYSYSSFNSSDPIFVNQEKVFNDLGREVLQNAWEGFNTSLFAYGQTGSGKSYSMLGYGEDKGIIPRVCEELFVAMRKLDDPNMFFKVEVSFMEIYNESVKDLLDPKKNSKGGLKVRNHPITGPYVEDLTRAAVQSYKEIEEIMDEGSKARTVAATNMNATSSRSHAVFTIVFTQSKYDPDTQMMSEKVSKINLVDLAGSERADSTGATGDRLKEGANINKSLSTLGKVISALAEASGGKKNVFVPYRDSVLTWLLKESLGGNAKTIMIAAISPADINYDETLSTLRYAERAKKIKNQAIVNEDPNIRLIRDLRDEIAQLKKLLGGGGTLPMIGADGVETEVLTLKEKLEQREKLIGELNKSWEERLAETQRLQQERETALQNMGVAVKITTGMPHLVNLNEDPILSDCLVYYLQPGETKIGRPDAEVPQNIQLSGLSINKEHAIAENKGDGVVTICPVGNSPVFVNGQLITAETQLPHSARVILGTNHIFRFHSGVSKQETKKNEQGEIIDWNFALKELFSAQNKVVFKDDEEQDKEREKELAQKLAKLNEEIESQKKESLRVMEQQRLEYEQKIVEMEKLVEEKDLQHMKEQARLAFEAQQHEFDARDKLLQEAFEKQKAAYMISSIQRWQEKKRRLQLQDELMQAMLTINEANAISEALHKNIIFNLKLSVADYKNLSDVHTKLKQTEMAIEMANRVTGKTGLLSYSKFMEKIFAMREAYERFLENSTTDESTNGTQEDPFVIPKEDRLLGLAHVYLKSLCFLVPITRNFFLVDPTGQEIGTIKVEVLPKDQDKELIEELANQTLDFTFKIVSADISSNYSLAPFDFVYCKFNLWDKFSDSTINDPSRKCEFNFEQQLHLDVNEEVVTLLKTTPLTIELWGHLTPNGGVDETPSLEPVPEEEDQEPDTQQNFEFLLKLEIAETDKPHEGDAASAENGENGHHLDMSHYSLAEVKDEAWANPGSIYNLTQSKHRILSFSIAECSDPHLHIEKCEDITIDNVRFLDTKERVIEPKITLSVVSVHKDKVIAVWPFSVEPLLIEKAQTKRLIATLGVSVKMNKFSAPIKITEDIGFRLLPRDKKRKKKEKSHTTPVLEQFRGMLQTNYKPKNQNTFRVKLTKEKKIDEQMEIISIIEQHKSDIQQVSNFLQAEKLRQEVELQSKLEERKIEAPPLSPTITKSLAKLEQTLTPKKEEEARMKLESPHRRSSKMKRPRAVSSIYVVVEEVNKRGYEKSGNLKKKRRDGSWHQKWFGFRRPYLYCCDDSQGRNERAIDTSKCVVTVGAHDAEHPFSFAIVTREKIWILCASSTTEMHAWMKAIDPSLDLAPGQRRLVGPTAKASVVSSLRSQSEEASPLASTISTIPSENQMIDGESDGYPSIVEVTAEDETIRTKLLETSLAEKTREVEEANEKLSRLQQLEEELRQAKATIAERDAKISSLRQKVAKAHEETGKTALELKLAEVTATLEERTKVLESVRAELREKLEEDAIKADNLVYKLAEAETTAKVREEEISKLRETSAKEDFYATIDKEREEKLNLQHNIKDLEAALTEKDLKISLLKEKLQNTLLESEVAAHSTQSLTERNKFLEEEINHYSSRMEMMQVNLKSACDELEKKDNLLREKIAKEAATAARRDPKVKLDPNMLEDQLRKLRDAMIAHQSHNAFLGQEIRRYESEFSKMQSAQSATILSLQKQIQALQNENRKLKLRDSYLTEKFGETPLGNEADKYVSNTALIEELKVQVLFLKQNYFMSLAVGQKLAQTQLGRLCNVQVSALFDEVIEKNIDVRDWPKWITNQILQASQSMG
eukprot:TRINITY_DN1532_c0_g2_i1.p1 TRINITY_DN1532_c0_g2~~TRINITY_DN1532_c0_g2_i1.p1  ORF type:complete len:1861 (+),score=489.46 TRINITY_DN1532_c0_g2_i1:320-5902(+)